MDSTTSAQPPRPKQARAKKTLDARSQIDLFERFRAPDKLGLLGHRAQFGRLHEDRRRRGALLRICSQAEQDHERRCDNEKKVSRPHHTPVTAELTDRLEINTPVGKADEGYSSALRPPNAS